MYGIRGIVLDWLKDYLSNRSQFTFYNNVSSPKLTVKCGVPQGSILGPLLFLLYINDLPTSCPLFYSTLFADDTSLFLSGRNIDETVSLMNIELMKVKEWLECNRLSLNIRKTKVLIFSTKRRHTVTKLNVVIDGEVIEKVNEIKFLGVILDHKLSWQTHIKKIKTKIAKNIGLLCIARKILAKSTLILLYNTFIQPYLIYCLEVWGSTNDSFLLPLLRIQKRAIRIIASVSPRTPSQPFFSNFNILKLNRLYQYMLAIFMFKYNRNLLPPSFCNLFTANEEIHNYYTRYRSSLRVPISCSVSQKRTVKYMGVTMWNNLCNNSPIVTNCSIFSFKKCLKRYLQLSSIL